MARGVFVAGTDTGVGKTLVAAALLSAANARGLSTAAVKPVASGCVRGPSGLQNDDALMLSANMSTDLPYATVNPVALEPAVAPHLAAVEASVRMSAAMLAEHCRRVLAMNADLTVIEGAGGWLVPLNTEETLADLAQLLQLPVVLVVGMRLGCINHALLSARAITASGLTLAGWVANCVQPAMDFREANVASVQQRLDAPLLGVVPNMRYPRAAEAAQHLSLDSLA